MAAPISLFPAAPSLTFAVDPALQAGVVAALGELAAARMKPVSFSLAIIDLGDGSAKGTLKYGAHKPGEVQYNASSAKVAAMFAAYALRDMARRFFAVRNANSIGMAVAEVASQLVRPGGAGRVGVARGPKEPPLFVALRSLIDPEIDASSPVLLKSVKRDHRVPHYEQVFAQAGSGPAAVPDFRGDYRVAMREMIVPSNNAAAGRCIRGVGYGYLNGTLAAAGLFDRKKDSVVWLAGDYVGIWPYARIDSTNDKGVAQAGSALGMAQMLALIVNRGFINAAACEEMRGILAESAKGVDQPFITREDAVGKLHIPLDKVTHCKLGLGPLKTGATVLSEIFRVEGLRKPGKAYAVAYQNVNERESSLADVAFMIRRTLEIYE